MNHNINIIQNKGESKMKTNFKKVLALATVLTMSVSMLAGCGTKVNDKNEKGQTVISVGNWPTNEGVSMDNANARKSAFEASNPDVFVEPDTWTFNRKTFYAKAAGGQLPTVFKAGVTEINEIINSEYSADLTDVLKERGYEGKFNPLVLDLLSRDGRIYAFPTSVDMLGLMVNMDLFKAAGLVEADGTPMQPETWDDVVEFAKKIKAATGKAGFVLPTADRSGGWLFTCLAWSFGADFMEKDTNGKWKATFNTPEAAAALQFVKDMKWKHDILPATSLIDNTEWYKILGTGNAGMTFAASAYPANQIYKYGIEPTSIGVIGMPKGPKAHVTLITGNVLCVSNTATKDQIDAALRWIETESSYKVTDNLKSTLTANKKDARDTNQLVGVYASSPWSVDTDIVKFTRSLEDEYINTHPNNVRLYNEFIDNCPCEIRPEEPVNAQELYSILDGCIQEVLSNENADVVKVLEKANADFQADYLDHAE